jgi:L-threonylcarbamoyladenylate synthase
VFPTDTLYGLVGSAFSKKAVKRIYAVKKRNMKKPLIVLIGSFRDVKRFGVVLTSIQRKFLRHVWPGPVSVILPVRGKKFVYLHRGTRGVAFRLPRSVRLRSFLKKTGPLVAPSANPEGKPPAKVIAQARRYFGDTIDFYIDGGILKRNPSTLLQMKGNGYTILRGELSKARS